MDTAPVAQALLTGVLFGLSAGLSPGPLLALVVTQTLRHGPGQGIRVALAPLLTDVPIVVLCTLLVGIVAPAGAALGVIALAGAGVVAWIARETLRADTPGPAAGSQATPARSWTRGAAVNALSPHPWLFWLTVGAPTLLASAAAGGPVAASVFLAGFYACLVGAKIAIAVAAGRARGRVLGRGYTWLMRSLAAVLAMFAAGLLVEGVSLLLSA
jgi:threonine/homoserine/homoserine lactone efflux protein